MNTTSLALTLRLVGVMLFGLIYCVSVNANNAGTAKGYQANADPQKDIPSLLGRFGELIARERAYHETIHELVRSGRGSSPFTMNESMLSGALGEDFYALYDEVLPMLDQLGQNSRRDELALRFDPSLQQQLIAGERIAGINEAAINNIVAHYKIAMERLDTSVRQLLLAESHLMRRSADELVQAFDASGNVIDYVSYTRASQLVSVPRQVKGFVQPRCQIESEALTQSRTYRNDVEDQFYFNQDLKFQSSVQAVYDAAGSIETLARKLNEDGSHCQ